MIQGAPYAHARSKWRTYSYLFLSKPPTTKPGCRLRDLPVSTLQLIAQHLRQGPTSQHALLNFDGPNSKSISIWSQFLNDNKLNLGLKNNQGKFVYIFSSRWKTRCGLTSFLRGKLGFLRNFLPFVISTRWVFRSTFCVPITPSIFVWLQCKLYTFLFQAQSNLT